MRLLAAGVAALVLAEARAEAVDFAEYLLPGNACSERSLANDFGSQRKFTIPMGMEGNLGRFLIMKGSDATGFEEWYVDSEWFYLRSDTTWAWQNPANPAEWCDTLCGTGNGNRRAAENAGAGTQPTGPTRPTTIRLTARDPLGG